MGGLRLCSGRTAQSPYFIKKISVNVYTIEELCFYLQNNFTLVDEGILNDDLFDWLECELGLPRLAGMLRQNVSGGASYRKLAGMILEHSRYCTREQIRSLMTQMEEKDKLPGSQLLKTVGDRMLENRKYEKAIREYRNILGMRQRDTQSAEFLAEVYHNMGVAYAQLFLYSQAAKCFAAAYDKGKDPDSRELYEAAVKLGGKPVAGFLELDDAVPEDQKRMSERLEQLVRDAVEDETVRRFQKIRTYKKEGRMEEYQAALVEFLDDLKKECSRYIGT